MSLLSSADIDPANHKRPVPQLPPKGHRPLQHSASGSSTYSPPPNRTPPPAPPSKDSAPLIDLQDSFEEVTIERKQFRPTPPSNRSFSPPPEGNPFIDLDDDNHAYTTPVRRTLPVRPISKSFSAASPSELMNHHHHHHGPPAPPTQPSPRSTQTPQSPQTPQVPQNNPASVSYVSTNRNLRSSAPEPPKTLRKSPSGHNSPLNTSGSESMQKTGSCTTCGVAILYIPTAGKKTLVRCYSCPNVTTFLPEDEPRNSIDDDAGSVGSEESSDDPQKKKSFNRTMRGAFKTLQQKAVDTKKNIQSSNFVAATKEKASMVAAKTKVAAQKTSEAAKNFAQKASSSSRSSNEESDGSPTQARPAPQPVIAAEAPRETQIFHVTLAEAVEKSATIEEGVPDVCTLCNLYIREKGIQEEGIFRLSGSMKSIQELREGVDRGETIDLSRILDQHVVSGLYKLYFRELPESIFTHRGGAELQKVAANDIEGFREVIWNLPPSNRAVLTQLLLLLNEISNWNSVNKMTVANLAIVFSATLGTSMEIMTPLITHAYDIFS